VNFGVGIIQNGWQEPEIEAFPGGDSSDEEDDGYDDHNDDAIFAPWLGTCE
jgi:hypothetical protein